MKRLLPILMACVVLEQTTMHVKADLSPEERTKLVDERAALTLTGTDDQRVAGITTFSSEFLDARQFWVLLYLAEDNSLKVRRAAIWNIGGLANHIPPDQVKPIADRLQKEYEKLQHEDAVIKDTDAFLQLSTACVWALHQIYFYCSVASADRFAEFESHDYIDLMTVIARRKSNQTVFHSYFLTMIEGVLTTEGVEGLLPLLKVLMEDADPAFVTGILLQLRDHYFLSHSEIGHIVFHDWVRNNATLFEAQFKQYSEMTSMSDSDKQALMYLKDEIAPILQAGNLGNLR